MAISEELQRRIDALVGDRPRPAQPLPYDPSGPAPDMVSGPYDPSNPPEVRQLPLPAPQLTDEERSGLMREIQRAQDFTNSVVQPTRGAISDRDMDIFMRAAPRNMGSARNQMLTPEIMQQEGLPQTGPLTPEIMEGASYQDFISQLGISPEEERRLEIEMENSRIRENAPMGLEAQGIQELGTGQDNFLIHTEFGDTIVPPQMIEDDPELEAMLERKFMEYNLDPEGQVVGSGIASLNPQTGLPEYGFFKKLIKGIGKVVKKVAPVAAFIPGVGTALGGVLGGVGSGITGAISKVAPRLGGALGSIGSSVMSGIGGLGIPGVSSIAGGTAGGFSGIRDALTSRSGLFGGGPFERIMGADPSSTAVRSLEAAREAAVAAGDMQQVAAIDAQLATYKSGKDIYSIIGTDEQGNPIYEERGPLGGTLGPKLRDRFVGSGLGGGRFGGGSDGGIGALGMAGLAGLAGTLGKMAYDETKKDQGVPITPMTAMGPTGRFNIEAEIARRMGLPPPNPVEFGLLPAGTFPELSGGMPLSREEVVVPQQPINKPTMPAPVRDVGITNRMDAVDSLGVPIWGGRDIPAQPITKDILRDPAPTRELMPMPQQQPVMPAPKPVIPVKRTFIEEAQPLEEVAMPQPLAPISVPLMRDLMSMPIPSVNINENIPQALPMTAPKPIRPVGLPSITQRKPVKRRVRGVGRRAYGGPVMAYAGGGDVNMQEFQRMNGSINGIGTETSDEIPAMLSDGEFVMTGKGVRGAGAYEMQKQNGGIISLVPNSDEDRGRGTQLMYDLMDEFSSKARTLQ